MTAEQKQYALDRATTICAQQFEAVSDKYSSYGIANMQRESFAALNRRYCELKDRIELIDTEDVCSLLAAFAKEEF